MYKNIGVLVSENMSVAPDIEERSCAGSDLMDVAAVAPSVTGTVSSQHPELVKNVQTYLRIRDNLRSMAASQRSLKKDIISQLHEINQSGVMMNGHAIMVRRIQKRVRRNQSEYRAFIGKFLKKKGVDDWKPSIDAIMKGRCTQETQVAETLSITKPKQPKSPPPPSE